MEGFVFDLQRFAGNAIYELFFGNTYSQGYYYIKTNVATGGIVTPDYDITDPVLTTNNVTCHIQVRIMADDTRTVDAINNMGSTNIIKLDFSSENTYTSTNRKIVINSNVGGTPEYDIVGIEGLKITAQ